MNNYIILILISLYFAGCGNLSNIYMPTELNIVGDYVHDSTQIVFPKTIGELNRTDITAFDKEKTNIGVSYKTSKTIISVYIYPAGYANAYRLKSEFYKSLQSIATSWEKDIEATQYPLEYSKRGYTFVSLNAEISKSHKSFKSLLSIFECGKWFLKFRITSDLDDITELCSLRDTLIEHFSPVDIVQRYPLKQKAHILFAPAILEDSLMTYSVMKGAFKHSAWVLHNVDSLQRCSGFPGYYLAEYTESLRAMVEGSKNRNMFQGSRDPKFEKYIRALCQIIDNGFLNEFVMDRHNLLLITPNDINLNIDGYHKWTKDNIKSDIPEGEYYIIVMKNKREHHPLDGCNFIEGIYPGG